MNLNQLLKNFRIKNHMTQEQLADKIHVSHQTISKWEQGINTPSIDNLLILSDLYNVSLDELIRGGNYLKKPFIVGKVVSKPRIILFFLIWLFTCSLFTGFGSSSIWLFLFIFTIGLIFLMPVGFEDYWVIEKKGLSIQLFPRSSVKKIKRIFSLLFNPNQKTSFLSFDEIESFELIYEKRNRYSPFDLNPDDFFIKIKTKNEEIYQLPISPQFQAYLPQACLYLEKKEILILDPHNLIEAIIKGERLYEYMNGTDNP